MVSVRKRGKVYEYRFEIATVEGTRKWITKSGYPTKAEAFKEGAKAYNDFYYNDQKTQLRENMSYADFLDYWIDNYRSKRSNTRKSTLGCSYGSKCVIMVDPASNQTDMWSAYEWSKSSQFNYFKAE